MEAAMLLPPLRSRTTIHCAGQSAVHLLVQRIDVVSDNEKTDFNVVSTLESVSEKLV